MGYICTRNNCYEVENFTKQDEQYEREDPYREIHWHDWNERYSDPVHVEWTDEVWYEREF